MPRAILLVVVFLALGCTPAERGSLTTPAKATSPNESLAKTPAPKSPRATVVDIDGPGLDAEIARHRGQVVFVDFWATWCEPCTEFFPHTVQLHHRFAERGFTAISVSLDDTESRDAVGDFLASQKAEFPHFMTTLGIGQKSFKQFGLTAGVPCFRLYGRDGGLIREWSSIEGSAEETAMQIEDEVKKALSQPAPDHGQ